MAPSDEENAEQFKLISLESNSIKPMAAKAKQAYNTYLKEDEEAPVQKSSMIINEDAPPQPPPKQQEPIKPKEQPKQQPRKPPPKEAFDDEEDDEEVDLSNTSHNIEELKETLSVLFENFIGTVSAIAVKIGSLLMKPTMFVVNIVVKVVSVPLGLINKFFTFIAKKLVKSSKKSKGKKEELIQEVVEQKPQVKLANFNDMIELNIIFTDNYKKNLYHKNPDSVYKLSKMEEELISANAIESIKECAEFTLELPPAQSGVYAGIPIHEIMTNATKEDVYTFLGFVKAFPGKYIAKSWKISETFATWLINNAPIG